MQGQTAINVSTIPAGKTKVVLFSSSQLYDWPVDDIELLPFDFSPQPCERAMYSEFDVEKN